VKLKGLIKFVLSISLPLAVGAAAGMSTSQSVRGWFTELNRPFFSPPNWVFAPVWTTIYILMGISFYLIWKSPAGRERYRAMAVYFVQLFLNFCWSFIFFYFRLTGWALAEIILLWLMIIAMIVAFYRVKPAAAYLNFPYLLWVTFASILNGAYFVLN
jgi:tryptophan-rich sensory protein